MDNISVDHVFGTDTSTSDVYDDVAREIISSTVTGFNGKTHTMQGDPKELGIIPRSVKQIFDTIEEDVGREYLLRVSYLEIYNEAIKDLLQPENTNLKIREDPSRGTFVEGLREEVVSSCDHVLTLMKKGEANRSVGKTAANDHSSRSHAIFRMVVESREYKEGSRHSYGAVKTLVDLAGSERVSVSQTEGTRMKEGSFINNSLLVLGTVISKLSEGHTGHIPFRDSKLTRLLQPSLGGNSKTAIIATITPAGIHSQESLATLKFANRAKHIKNKPRINEVASEETLIRRYKKEIEDLKRQLDAKGADAGSSVGPDLKRENEEMARQLKEQAEKLHLQERLDKMAHLLLHGSGKVKKPKRDPRRETWTAPVLRPRKFQDQDSVELNSPDFRSFQLPSPAQAAADPSHQGLLGLSPEFDRVSYALDSPLLPSLREPEAEFLRKELDTVKAAQLAEREQFEAQIAKLNQDLAAAQKESKASGNEEQLLSQIDLLKQEIQLMKETEESLEELRVTLTEENEQLQEQLEEYANGQAPDFEVSATKYRQQIQMLEGNESKNLCRIQSLTERVAALESENETLKSKVEQYDEQEFAREKAQWDNALKSPVQDSASALQALRLENTELRETLQQLNLELNFDRSHNHSSLGDESSSLEDKEQLINGLSDKVNELELKLETAEKQLEEAVKVEEAAEKLEACLAESMEENQRLTETLEAAEEKLGLVETQYDTYKKSIADLQAKLESAEAKLLVAPAADKHHELEQEYEKCQHELKQTRFSFEQLESASENAQSKFQQEKEELRKEHEREKKYLSQALKEKEAELEQLESQIAGLKKELLAASNEAMAATKEIAVKDTELKEVQEEIQLLTRQLPTGEQEAEAQKQRAEILRLRDLLSELSSASNTNSNARNKTDREASLAEKKAAAMQKEMTRETEQLKSKLEQTEQKLKSATQEKTGLLAEKAKLERENTTMQKQLEGSLREIEKLKTSGEKSTKSQQKISSLEKQVEVANKETEKLKGRLEEELQSALDTAAEGERLRTSLSECKVQLDVAKAETKRLTDQCSQLKEALSESQQQCSELTEKLSSVSKALREKENTSTEQITQLQHDVSVLTTERNRESNNRLKLEEEFTEVWKQLEETKATLESESIAYQDKLTRLSKDSGQQAQLLAQQVHQLRTEAKSREEEIQKQQQKIGQLNGQLEKLRVDLDQRSSAASLEVQQKENKIAGLSGDLREMIEKEMNLEDRINVLTAECEQQNDHIEELLQTVARLETREQEAKDFALDMEEQLSQLKEQMGGDATETATKLVALRAQIKEYQTREDELNRHVEELNRELTEARSQKRTSGSEEELAAMKRRIDGMEATAINKEKEKRKLVAQMRDMKKQISTMEAIIRESKQSIETLEEDKAALLKQLTAADKKKPLQARNVI